LGSGL
jgi:type IV secretion system protein VirB1